MLKIITSVILSLVTIMAVTMFAVTVPAQQKQIDDNAAAIEEIKGDVIYLHQIEFQTDETGTNAYVSLYFYNNSKDKFDTYTKLLNYNTIFTLPANGRFQTGGAYYSVFSISRQRFSNSITITGNAANSGSKTITPTEFTSITDNVILIYGKL